MTNPFLQSFDATAHAAFLGAGIADEASFVAHAGATAVACRVMVDRDVEAFGFDSRTVNSMVVISALVAEVGSPRRGAVFTIGAERFVVDAVLDADEGVVRMQVHEEAA